MRFEEVSTAHIREWGGIEGYPPDERITGFAARLDGGELVALAMAYLDDDAVWRAAFARRPGCTAGVHHEVRRSLQQVLDAGVVEILASPDPTVKRSAEYLRWLGFTPREDGEWILCRLSSI